MNKEHDFDIYQKESGKYYFHSLDGFSTDLFESRFQGFSLLQGLYDGDKISIENAIYLVEELLRLPLTTLPKELRNETIVLGHEINFISEIEEFQESLANMLITRDISENLDNLPAFILCPNHSIHGHIWIINKAGEIFFSNALRSRAEALLWVNANRLIYKFKDEDVDRMKYQIFESGITTHFKMEDLGISKINTQIPNNPN